jgi:AcrR family transcriptional regulator
MPSVKRSYHAPRREQQAAATRQRIAEAAAGEFSDHGWAGTTLGAIAARAEVTPQAVHLAVGGKAALLVRAVEVTVAGDPSDALLADRPAFDDVYAERASPRRRLAALAAATAEIYGRAARLFLVLQEAAQHDPVAAELADQAGARRMADHRRLARLLLPGARAERVTALADTIWVLAGPGVYVDLVHRRGWSGEQYTTWLTGQLQCALKTTAG